MYVSAFVRRYILRLPLGKPFARQDLVEFGSDAAVDQTLARLKKEGLSVSSVKVVQS